MLEDEGVCLVVQHSSVSHRTLWQGVRWKRPLFQLDFHSLFLFVMAYECARREFSCRSLQSSGAASLRGKLPGVQCHYDGEADHRGHIVAITMSSMAIKTSMSQQLQLKYTVHVRVPGRVMRTAANDEWRGRHARQDVDKAVDRKMESDMQRQNFLAMSFAGFPSDWICRLRHDPR